MNATAASLTKMQTERYTVTFLTPAFLGDAEQNARWRTPPFKHLLREWWRVAWAEAHSYPTDDAYIERLRRTEGQLFGNAWLNNAFRKSELRLRLSNWETGSQRTWPSDLTVRHPEVGQGGRDIGSALYLGYGPLEYRQGTALKKNAAIQQGESAELRLAWPDAEAQLIERALKLAGRYGALGGRSRNGWGSFALERQQSGSTEAVQPPLRDWRDCLDRDWPHAIGDDEVGPLIWRTNQMTGDWREVMRALARLKIGLRTHFPFTTGRHAHPDPRHWLAYPVTNHSVEGWGPFRLPNQLRFRVRRSADDPKQLIGIVFHMPHLPPASFRPDRGTIEHIWRRVHRWLDQPANGLRRIDA